MRTYSDEEKSLICSKAYELAANVGCHPVTVLRELVFCLCGGLHNERKVFVEFHNYMASELHIKTTWSKLEPITDVSFPGRPLKRPFIEGSKGFPG